LKKILFVILFSLSASGISFAAGDFTDYLAKDFPRKMMIGPRLGLLSYYTWVYSGVADLKIVPPIGINFEIPLIKFMKTDNEFLKPVSLGGQFMYQSFSYSFNSYDWLTYVNRTYTWTFSYTSLSLQAVYYFDVKSKNVHPYTKLNLGYTIYTADYDGYFDNYFGTTGRYSSPSAIGYNFSAGIKWLPVPNLAIVGEVGYGFSVFQIGVDLAL
jgi:hypothetical protein